MQLIVVNQKEICINTRNVLIFELLYIHIFTNSFIAVEFHDK